MFWECKDFDCVVLIFDGGGGYKVWCWRVGMDWGEEVVVGLGVGVLGRSGFWCY